MPSSEAEDKAAGRGVSKSDASRTMRAFLVAAGSEVTDAVLDNMSRHETEVEEKQATQAEQKAKDDHAEQERLKMKHILFYNRRGMAIEEKTSEREHILILAWRGESDHLYDDYSPTLELPDGYDSRLEDENPHEPDTGDAMAIEFGKLCNIKSPVKGMA